MGKCYTTNLCLTDTDAKRVKIGMPRGRTILTNMKNVCDPHVCHGEVGPLWGDGRGLLEQLSEAQETIFARGPNFTVMPKCSTKEKDTDTVEEPCLKLPHQGDSRIQV